MRQKINFNTNWLYLPNDCSNAYLKNCDESDFESVCVPHANKILEKHKGYDFQQQINSYRFVSWYRRHFSLSEGFNGRRMIIEFEAVANVANVYVNGKYVGEHRGAYTGFSFDITDYVTESDNVIAVRVDSTKRPDIPPEGGDVDYCLFGGIVRNVNMIVTGNAYVENTYITTPDLADSKGESSTIAARTRIINKSGQAKAYTVETILLDADENIVTSVSSIEEVNDEAIYTQHTDNIHNPNLWTLDAPYLYTVIIRVKDCNTVVDEYETQIGFRWFGFNNNTSDASFYLNGNQTKIIGINRHEQWPWIGRAVNDKLQAADADLIKETGFNAVRCSHYPQAVAFLKRCDEIGLMVFEEAPGWQHIGDEAWQEIYKLNIEEMIIRDRNHPSIISWGTRVNESEDNRALYTESNNIAHSLDPTRPTHGVRNEFAISRNSEFLDNEDIYAINYQYPGITYESTAPVHLPYIVTEHSNDWYKTENKEPHGVPWASDTDAIAFMKSFGDVMDAYYGNDLWAGGFAWSMFDYNNEVNYTKTEYVFYSGIYDIFRYPKPAAYLYKSQIYKEPMVYIANNWDRNSPLVVTVMSNCDEVELFVNGKSIGTKQANLYLNIPHPLYEFSVEKYEAGKITAVGYVGGKEKARYTQHTPGTAKKLKLTPDYDTLVADGSDLTSIKIEVLDENGQRLPYGDNEVTISVVGAGNFIGERTVSLEGGRSAFFVQSQYLKTGKIICTVDADGVQSDRCEINVFLKE